VPVPPVFAVESLTLSIIIIIIKNEKIMKIVKIVSAFRVKMNFYTQENTISKGEMR